MNNPILSIIIPIYNAEHYLCQCIESVLSQSFGDYELILVDDGSTDSSGSMCDKYASENSQVRAIHQKNRGVSFARNEGIRLSRGKWLTFIDSDDYIETGFFDIDYSSSADLVLQQKSVIGQNNMTESYPRGIYQGEELKELLTSYLTGELFRVPWGKFFRASIVKGNNIQFALNYRLGEDALFMLDYFYYCRQILIAGDANYMYRVVGDFISRYKMSFEECVNYIGELLAKYDRLGIDSKRYLALNYTFYTGIVISHHNNKQTHDWFRDKNVLRISKMCSDFLPSKTKLKYMLYKHL